MNLNSGTIFNSFMLFFPGYENPTIDWEGHSRLLNLESLDVGQTVSMNNQIMTMTLSLCFICLILMKLSFYIGCL